MFCVFAMIPTASINFSDFINEFIPSVDISEETELLSIFTDFKLVFVLISIPLFIKLFCTIFEISSSSFGKIFVNVSITVTLTPKSL